IFLSVLCSRGEKKKGKKKKICLNPFIQRRKIKLTTDIKIEKKKKKKREREIEKHSIPSLSISNDRVSPSKPPCRNRKEGSVLPTHNQTSIFFFNLIATESRALS
ncbi:hypothetical protein PanWU01x14_052090, partial [Parasponia andersonii]